MHPRSLSLSEIQLMQEFYDLGHNSLEVARQFGKSKTTVLKYVKTRERIPKSKEEKQIQLRRAVHRRRKELKRLLVEYKGGKCTQCGYNKCLAALEFHHKDPTQKSFSLSYYTFSLDRLKKEADKCDLVCANCHREIEDTF